MYNCITCGIDIPFEDIISLGRGRAVCLRCNLTQEGCPVSVVPDAFKFERDAYPVDSDGYWPLEGVV